MFGWFDSIMEMFSEKKTSLNGNVSMTRILTAFIVVVIMSNWTFFNIKAGSILPLDWQTIVILISSLSAKVVQKKFERKD